MRLLFKILIIFFFFSQFTNVNAENAPDSLFGIKLFDNINNYKIIKTKDFSKSPVPTIRYQVVPPNPNEKLDEYWVATYPNDSTIVRIAAYSNVTSGWIAEDIRDTRYPPNNYQKKLLLQNSRRKISCTNQMIPQYVSLLSDLYKIKFNEVKNEIFRPVPEIVFGKRFLVYPTASSYFKKNNKNLVLSVLCNVRLEGIKDELSIYILKEEKTLFWIVLEEEEYAKKFKQATIIENSLETYLKKVLENSILALKEQEQKKEKSKTLKGF